MCGGRGAAGYHVWDHLTPERLHITPDVTGHPADVPAFLIQYLMHQEVRLLDRRQVSEGQALVDLRRDLGAEQEVSARKSWQDWRPRKGLQQGSALWSSHAE